MEGLVLILGRRVWATEKYMPLPKDGCVTKNPTEDYQDRVLVPVALG